MGNNFDASRSLLLRYVEGELPLEGSLPWCHAREVYGIAHVCGNHWVAYTIDLVRERIVVYDSLAEVNCWQRMKSQFIPLAQFVPRLLMFARNYNAGFSRFKNLSEWPVVASVPPPQQEGTRDCAIMAMKFIECLASDYAIDKIQASKCSRMRLYYCAQLFNAGMSSNGICSV